MFEKTQKWLFLLLSGPALLVLGCSTAPPPRAELPVVLPLAENQRRLPVSESSVEVQELDDYLKVVAGGDVMIGHWTLDYLRTEGPDYPFRMIAPLLKSGDIAFANLEAPLADSGNVAEKRFTFKVPTKYVSGLQTAGFNLLSLANNHMLDFGALGLEQTLVTLDEAGILHTGAGRNRDEAWQPAVFYTPAGTVAALAFSMTFPKEFWATDSSAGTAYPYEEKLIRTLDDLARQVDFLIVSFHWGTEKKDTPNDYQIYFAHLAIDHGADLVLGHHPHILQGLEIYKNRLIAYSLGNLAFSSFSYSAVNSMLLKVVLHRNGLLFAHIYPLNVDNSEVLFQPRLAGAQRSRSIIAHLDSLSYDLNGFDIITDDGMILGNMPPLAMRSPRVIGLNE